MNVFSLMFITSYFLAVVLAFKKVRYGVLFILLAIPFYVPIKSLSMGGIFFSTWQNILTLLLAFIVFANICLNRKTNFRLNNLDIIMVLVFSYGMFQALNSYMQLPILEHVIKGFRDYYLGILFYFAVRFSIKKEEDLKFFTKVMLFMIFLVSIEGIIEFFLLNLNLISASEIPWLQMVLEGKGSNLSIHFRSVGGIIRIPGVFVNPQTTGVFILIGVLLQFPFIFSRKVKGYKGLFLNQKVFLILLIGLMLAQSRTAIISFIIILVYMLLKHRIPLAKLLFYSLIPITILSTFSFEYTKKFLIKSIEWYLYYLHEKDFPIFADLFTRNFSSMFIGYGFPVSAYLKSLYGVESIGASTHLFILNYTYQLGLFGLILFALQNFMFIKTSMNIAAMEKDRYLKNLCIGLSLCIVAFVLSTLHYNSLLQVGANFYYYTILASIGSILNIKKALLFQSKHSTQGVG